MEAVALLKEFNLIHLTGEKDFQLVKSGYEKIGACVFVRPFLREMELAYNAADLVVSRAGAASLTEIAHYRLPNVLIPYPYAAERHQERNAEIFQAAGASELLPQEKLDGQNLAAAIRALWGQEERRRKMAEQLAAFAKPAAIGEIILLLRKAARFQPVIQITEVTA
jgi:UDP-N-acetylglucosamine--N-acetylmuramyl-(pentapeptide) pyrophosphoryl-undecaprenol N-acetylglucosamine transferase